MKNKLRWLWITDPWDTLDHSKDTTLRWIREAGSYPISQYWCDVRSIRLEGGRIPLAATPIHEGVLDPATIESEAGAHAPSEFGLIHYRTDPPVNEAYLHPLALLALGLRGAGTEFVNPLEILFSRNEKMEGAALGDLMPPSLVSSQWEHLEKSGRQENRTVLKPLHEAQSHGVEFLDWSGPEEISQAREQLRAATRDFTAPVILQRYLPGIAKGEIRLWFLDGELLAAVRKLPLQGDFRVNLDRGSPIAKVELSEADRERASRIGLYLQNSKIRLAAVDLIDGFVTDFNFTSPGLIVQMEELLGENLSSRIIRAFI